MVSAIRSGWTWIIVFILIFPFVTTLIIFLSLLSAASIVCVVSLSNLKLFIIIHLFSSGRRLLR